MFSERTISWPKHVITTKNGAIQLRKSDDFGLRWRVLQKQKVFCRQKVLYFYCSARPSWFLVLKHALARAFFLFVSLVRFFFPFLFLLCSLLFFFLVLIGVRDRFFREKRRGWDRGRGWGRTRWVRVLVSFAVAFVCCFKKKSCCLLFFLPGDCPRGEERREGQGEGKVSSKKSGDRGGEGRGRDRFARCSVPVM